MISSKEQIIDYFKTGIKNTNQFKIGIEHEKFLFDLNSNKRVNYETILKMFKGLYEFVLNDSYAFLKLLGSNSNVIPFFDS